jgi:hypothetical protein
MSNPTNFVPFAQRPLGFRVAFLVTWLTVIVSGLVFGLSFGYGLLTGTDMNWLAFRAGVVCFPATLYLLRLVSK